MIAATTLLAVFASPALVASPDMVKHNAICPRGMVPNPAGYGCVPDMAPGAPSQEAVTRCNGNLYFCVWPYGVP